jgi:NTE family protein
MSAPICLALAVLACSPQDAPGPEPAPDLRPRVGLVLSSGAAHTLAQVGALEVLEELRIPVDFIVGSEGGALIGGLHAAGLSAHEIRAQLQDRIWLDALSGKVPRELLSWRQRSVERDFLFDLPVAFGPERIGLARGLARTRWISWLLSSATLRTAGAVTFDDLPIPFRAVALDLLTGEPLVLDAGNLPASMLASMATPGLYAPVLLAGREVGSGALSDPLPVGVALDAGCDVLIVVDCTFDLDEIERLASFLTASAHVRVLAGESAKRAARARIRPTDVVLEPDSTGTGEQDYRGAEAMLERGRTAAWARAHALERLALDPAGWAEHLALRRARLPTLPELGTVTFDDASGLDPTVLRARVQSTPGAPLDERRLSEDLLRLYGLDHHERIDLEFRRGEDGRADLSFIGHDAPERRWNPRAGVALEGVFGQDATYLLGGAFTLRPLDGVGAEWRNRVEVGSKVLLLSEYWKPIDRTARWFIAPSIGYEQQRVNVTVDEDVLAVLDTWEASARFDVGRVLGEWGEARLGLVKNIGATDLAIGAPDQTDDQSFDEGFLAGSVTLDTVDSLALPRVGSIGRVLVTSPVDWLGGDQESYLLAQVDRAVTWGRTTLDLGAEFNTALDDEDALQNAFPLGGFLRLSGLGRDAVSGAHLGLVRAATWVELGDRGLDRRLVGWNVGGSLEAGQTWADRDDISLTDLRLSGSVFLAAETMFGPFFLGAGWTEPDEAAVFLLFGNLFGNWAPF